MLLRKRVILAALLGGLAIAAPAIAATVGGYDFKSAPVADRGRLKAISDNAAYGYTYLHEQGWYQVVLPQGARTDPGSAPNVRTFDVPSAGRTHVCTAAVFPEPKLLSFSALQARLPGYLQSWEADISRQIVIAERGMLELRDDGQMHVALAAWTGEDRLKPGRIMTIGVVEVPRGTLMLGCSGTSVAESRFLTSMVFFLAEGAL